jgi:hypothetical protein
MCELTEITNRIELKLRPPDILCNSGSNRKIGEEAVHESQVR